MAASSAIRDVSDTAFWVAYYRMKETERRDALFRDPLAKLLVGERGQQIAEAMASISRYTEWSVISRTVIIDRFVAQLVSAGVDAVINLGAGLDTRPYRMNLPANLSWVEADHPHIVEHKEQVLRGEAPTCRLIRRGVDLANADQRTAFLDEAVPEARRVLVLTEGVIPYLRPDQVTELGRALHARPRNSYWIAEYYHPSVYRYLQGAVKQASMHNAPFQFFPDNWFGFFGAAGWVEKETRYAGEIAHESGRKMPMPRWAELLFRVAPKKVQEEAMRRFGYTVLERSS